MSSPHLSKALIGRLDLHRPHKISIQSFCSTGQVSTKVHTYFEDVLSDNRGSLSDLGSAFLDDDVDNMSSIESVNVYKNNDSKTVSWPSVLNIVVFNCDELLAFPCISVMECGILCYQCAMCFFYISARYNVAFSYITVMKSCVSMFQR